MSFPVLGALALTLATLSPVGERPTSDVASVAQALGSVPGLTTLRAAVDAAGLTGVLDGDGPFTVLAPSDEAFAALPAGTVEALLRPEARADLVALLERHVIAADTSAAAAVTVGRVGTLSGDVVDVSVVGGRVRVDGAAVVRSDLVVGNGRVHVIDAVLLAPTPVRLSGIELVLTAIERGVPLFNNDQPAACAAVYEVAAVGLLGLDDRALPDAPRAVLARSLTDARATADPRERAWILRFALDETAAALARDPAPGETTASAGPERRVLFDFSDDEDGWLTVNDDVMGGVSLGGMRASGQGTGLFAGRLSLENNGGFSSTRSRGGDLDLAGWDGLTLRVRGDGRTYRVAALKSDSRREVHVWQAEFTTVEDEWIEVRVPFDALSHNVMGWTVPDGSIDPAAIRSLSFSIADKDTRPFALEVDWIAAWRE